MGEPQKGEVNLQNIICLKSIPDPSSRGQDDPHTQYKFYCKLGRIKQHISGFQLGHYHRTVDNGGILFSFMLFVWLAFLFLSGWAFCLLIGWFFCFCFAILVSYFSFCFLLLTFFLPFLSSFCSFDIFM